MLLSEPDKYTDAISAIKKDIAYMLIELKKTWGRKYYLMNASQMAFILINNYQKLVNNHSHN